MHARCRSGEDGYPSLDGHRARQRHRRRAFADATSWVAGRDPEAREKAALRIIAISFFALAAYVTVESVRALVGGAEAGHSSMVADSKQTLLCTYLSAVLLVGLGLNSLFGWSWPTRSPRWSSPRGGGQGVPRGVAG